MLKITKEQLKKFTPEILIVSTLCVGIFFAWYVNLLHLTNRLVDQNSHLNLSRIVWDSLTPGISQIGFWPPLLHILMAPLTISDFLYMSGLAGAILLVPFLAFASWFFYKLSYRFTHNKLISFVGGLLFSLNPYILYYSVTPMMETLFLAHLLGTAYFLFRWLETKKLRYLVLTSLFIALASISRFEGFILVPLTGIIILIDLLRKKKNYFEVEATVIVFSIIASLGVVSVLIYGFAFGNNPFSFANSNWSSFSQQRDYFLPTEGHPFVSFQYLGHASYYMIGKSQVWIGSLAFVGLLFFVPSIEVLAIGLLLISPFLFDWLALFRGNIIVYVADLPPYDVFFNERYGLYCVGFTLLFPIAAIGLINAKLKALNWKRTAFGITSTFLIVFSVIQVSFLYQTAYAEHFKTLEKSSQGYPSNDQKEIASFLHEHYDGGKILITRALHDFVTVNAGVPLREYIHEANFLFYDQALTRPWLFARWVVMYNLKDHSISLDWAKDNEKVSVRWSGSAEFLHYYELVKETQRETLYKVKESAVLEYIEQHNLNGTEIPSLNTDIIWWDPTLINDQMKK